MSNIQYRPPILFSSPALISRLQAGKNASFSGRSNYLICTPFCCCCRAPRPCFESSLPVDIASSSFFCRPNSPGCFVPCAVRVSSKPARWAPICALCTPLARGFPVCLGLVSLTRWTARIQPERGCKTRVCENVAEYTVCAVHTTRHHIYTITS